MSVISNVLVILNVSVHWQNLITGVILIIAVVCRRALEQKEGLNQRTFREARFPRCDKNCQEANPMFNGKR